MEIPVNYKSMSMVFTAAFLVGTCVVDAAADDAADVKGDFSVLTRATLLHGGESEEPAIVPGDPDDGTLVSAISWEDYEMPPKENDRLSEEQIAMVRRWIEQGAPWPDETQQAEYRREESMRVTTEDGVMVATSGGTSGEWTNRRYQPADLWAYAPVKQKSEMLPSNVKAGEAIDFYINRGLDHADLTASEVASPRTLIRRATLDLTGLPPSPKEIDAFAIAYKQDAKQAWESLINGLLESPRYGEHWARHWFDVTDDRDG